MKCRRVGGPFRPTQKITNIFLYMNLFTNTRTIEKIGKLRSISLYFTFFDHWQNFIQRKSNKKANSFINYSLCKTNDMPDFLYETFQLLIKLACRRKTVLSRRKIDSIIRKVNQNMNLIAPIIESTMGPAAQATRKRWGSAVNYLTDSKIREGQRYPSCTIRSCS